MKILYSFFLNKTEEVDEISESVNEAGDKTTVTKKVKKEIPVKFSLRIPSRSMRDEAELFYGTKFSEALKAGFLTNALVDKRVNTDGGVLTKADKDLYDEKLKEFGEKRAEYLKLDESEDSKPRKTELEGLLMVLRKEIQDFDVKKNGIYDNTAETYARNKTTSWWFLNLSLREEKPIFEGDYDKKVKKWDELEDSDDEFLKAAYRKLFILTSFYHRGAASTTEEFDSLLKVVDDIK